MCVNCMTYTEAVLLNGAGVAAVVATAVSKVRNKLDLVGTNRRNIAAWDKSAVFIESLGQDPVACLGPRPAVVERVVSPAVALLESAPPTPVRQSSFLIGFQRTLTP